MTSSSKPLAGPGYVILNILRCMNIIALVMVIVASWIMLVKTFVVSKFFFFDAVSHLITSWVGVFLIVSEVQLFKMYFTKNWPLLGPLSGLVTLGSTMIVVGVSILGNLNKQATSQESLGYAFWRIVIAAGILVAILGFLNIAASFVFQDRRIGLTARQVRSHGAVAAAQHTPALPSSTGSRRSFHNDYLNGRQSSERSAGSSGLRHQPTVRSHRSIGLGRRDQRQPLTISRPINFNPQFNDYIQPAPLQRPLDAHHPAYSEKV